MFRNGATRCLVFRVSGERFAVPLEDVHEVIDLPPVQPVPDAPGSVIGIAMLRGGYVTIYDASATLGLATTPAESVLLFHSGDRRVGIAVSDVVDAIAISEDELRPAPDRGADRMLAGLVWRGAELTAVLHSRALLDAAMALEGEPT